MGVCRPRGGTTTPWWFGDDPSKLRANGTFGKYRPISSPANPFGLYEIYGGVWEWCAEEFLPDAYSLATVQPGKTDRLTRRGGAFSTGPTETRSAYRKGSGPTYRGVHVGFRVLREIQLN